MSVQALPSRYSIAAIILHWVLAALLLFQLSLGWRLEDLTGLSQFTAFQLHKTIGIAILLLSFARLAIRIIVPRPPTANTSPALAVLAGGVHALLYVVMIGGPITGWIVVSTASVKVKTMFLGFIPWPHLPLPAGWHDPANAAHGLLGWLFAGLVILHVAGALKHHWMREDILGRMVPSALASRKSLNIVAVAAVVGGVVALAFAKLLPFGGVPSAPSADPSELALANNATNEALLNEAGGNEAGLNAPALNAAASPPSEQVQNEAAAKEEPATAAEKATPWQVQSGGRLGFRADYSGSAVEGSFTRWTADIVFSPEDLPNSRITVTVELDSVDSADSQRDDTLRSDGFFDVAAHPRATFRSSRITHRSGNAYRAAGTLSLHGQQKPVTLNFTLDIDGDKARAAGTAPLSRTAFGVGTGEWADTDSIKDNVTVNFAFTAQRRK